MRKAAGMSTAWPAGPTRFQRLLESSWVAPAIVLVVAVLVRLIGIDRLPSTDELYTVLAARGWVGHGVPVIAQGVYERAELFTILIGSFFKVLGDSVVVARIPSVIAGSLLVVAVFLWTRSVAGRVPAWIAAAFVCFSPLDIIISQFARFYALLGLMTWLGAVGIYALVDRRLPTLKALLVALGSGLCLLFALHLQVLAAMGIAGLSLWLVYAVGVPWLRARHDQRTRWSMGLALAVVALMAAAQIAFSVHAGGVERLWNVYRWSPLWSIEHVNEFWFYHVWFVKYYQSLWPILPFLAILAIARQPKPATFCFVVFTVVFVLLSFGGMKDRRYVSFVLPFLFVLWGIALAELGPLLVRVVATATPRALHNLDPSLANRLAGATVIGLSTLFLIVSNGAPVKTLSALAGGHLVGEGSDVAITTRPYRADWAGVKAPLAPWLNTASIVLTSHDVETLHGLGRYDIVINANRMSEISPRPWSELADSGNSNEFGIDFRTGRPVISQPESLRLVMSCYPDGLILADEDYFRRDEGITDPVADVIERETVKIDLPRQTHVLAFHWQHPVPDPPPAACATLPKIKGPPRAASGTASPPGEKN
jgi:4-amino-4-deoxy-L-arabinose transferase-like glycosyltransferase